MEPFLEALSNDNDDNEYINDDNDDNDDRPKSVGLGPFLEVQNKQFDHDDD